MPESSTKEPTIQPLPSKTERRLNYTLARTASVLASVVAIFLIAFAGVALIGMIARVVSRILQWDFSRAAVEGLDAAFLVIILLELVHTTISRGPVTRQLQEFIVIGITASIRSGLEVVAEHGQELRSVVINMGFNAASVLILVVALWIVRTLDARRGPGRAEGP